MQNSKRSNKLQKKIIFILIFISTIIAIPEAKAQNVYSLDNTAIPQFFFNKQAGVRGESMAKAMTADENDMFSVFYNPANIGLLKGLTVSGSYITQIHDYKNDVYDQDVEDTEKSTFFGVGYNFSKYLQAGFSINSYRYSDQLKQKTDNYKVTLSSEILDNLFIGTNLNQYKDDLLDDKCFSLDLGFNYLWKFYSDVNSKHSLNIAGSFQSINNPALGSIDETTPLQPQVTGKKIEFELPVIFSYGLSYKYVFLNTDKKIYENLPAKTQFVLNFDYRTLNNSDFRTGISFGTEITVFDVLSFRFGFFDENDGTNKESENSDHTGSHFDWNKTEYTYGFGINFPLKKMNITKTPIDIKLDFAPLGQTTGGRKTGDDNGFFSYSLTLKFAI